MAEIKRFHVALKNRAFPAGPSSALLLLALCFLTSGARGTEASQPLTLASAIAIAEAHNRELALADAGSAIAAAAVDAALAARRPRVGLGLGVQRSDHPVLVFGNLLSQERFSAENFALERLNRPAPLEDWTSNLTASQTLWAGGQLKHDLAAALKRREATSATRERARQQVTKQVIERYTAAVLAGHQLAVAVEAVATAAAHRQLAADLYQGGLVVESDLLLAQVRESEIQELLIRADSHVAISCAALNLVLGRALDTPLTLPDDLSLEEVDELELQILTERARQQRPDLRAAESLGAAATSQVAASRAAWRPRVGLEASYQAHAENFFGRDGDSTTVAVGLRLPLFDGGRSRAQTAQAEARAAEAAAQTALLQDNLALEVHQTFHELRAAHQRLNQAAKGVELARRGLEIVEDRYREGLVTLPELLEAQSARTAARLRQVAARRDILLAKANLDLATGAL